MKIKLDKKYLKISLYVVFTIAAAYFVIICLNATTYALSNPGEILNSVSRFFRKLIGVFLPIVIAFATAYILDPLVSFFQSRFAAKKPTEKRLIGTLLAYLVIISALSAVVIFAYVKINANDSGSFAQNLSKSVTRTIADLNDFYAEVRLTLIDLGVSEYLSSFFDSINRQLTTSISSFFDFEKGASSIGSTIIDILLSFVMAFYFLKDKTIIQQKLKVLPNTFLRETARRRLYHILDEINAVFSGYIRGQLTDALIMSILLSIGLTLCGVRFAVVIGIFSGLANIVPYFGALAAFALSVATALIAGTPATAVSASIVVLVLQQIDGIFIVPRVVGQKVELSPIMVIISLAVSGRLFGFWGLVFAVPLFATGKIFFQRLINGKQKA